MAYRVLHIVPSVGCVSGISRVLVNYYKNIDKKIIQFDFLCLKYDDTNYEKTIQSLGGKCYYLKNIFNYISFKKNINNFCKIHKNEYSVIHLHMPFLSIFFYELKKKLNAKVFVIHAHSTKYGDSNFTNLRNKLLYNLFSYKADSYFACSNDAGLSLFKKDYLEKGFFMFNIINFDDFNYNVIKDKAKKELSISDSFVIGHVGIFNYPKNHYFIIDIFAEVYKKNHNSKLLLVGDGKLRNKIEDYSKYKKVYENVLFVGASSDVGKYYSAMDVFLFPSIFEGFAMSFIEAQSFNIPCVASNIMVFESNISKNMNKFLSLNDKAEKWAKVILDVVPSSVNCKNNRVFDEMSNRVKLLEKKYLSLIENYEKV